MVINPRWVDKLSSVTIEQDNESTIVNMPPQKLAHDPKIKDDVENLKKEFQMLKDKVVAFIEGEREVEFA